jgi:hypothetical protein
MKEFHMRTQVSLIALTLLAGTTAASAQTVITRDIFGQPVETVITQQPVQTVQTIQTTRTIGPARSTRRQVVTTRRTITTERVAPAVAATYPQPLYDVAAPLDVAPPLYDTVAPAPPPRAAVVGMTPVAEDIAPPVYGTPFNTAIPTYRYVYEPDRILVIDPATNIAIQAIPR